MKRLLSVLCAIAEFASISFAAMSLKFSYGREIAMLQDDSVNGLGTGIGLTLLE